MASANIRIVTKERKSMSVYNFRDHLADKSEQELEAIIDAFDVILQDIEILKAVDADPKINDWRSGSGSARAAAEGFGRTMLRRRDEAHQMLGIKRHQRERSTDCARSRLARWLSQERC